MAGMREVQSQKRTVQSTLSQKKCFNKIKKSLEHSRSRRTRKPEGGRGKGGNSDIRPVSLSSLAPALCKYPRLTEPIKCMLETHKSPELRKGCKSCLRLSFRREEARSKEGAEGKTCEPGSGWTERMLPREHRERGTGKLLAPWTGGVGDESYGFQRVILHRVETTLWESFSFSLPGSPEASFPSS